MKRIWNGWLKDTLLLYCGIYTFATVINSIAELCRGIPEDPAGNWHELDRAVIVLILVLAYALIRYGRFRSFLLKAASAYLPTAALAMLYVFLRGRTGELAPTAYRDVLVNYTAGFGAASLMVCGILRIRKKKCR